jgi:hypothetical protein
MAVGGIEIAGVVLHGDGEMLLDRRGARQRRGIEPRRHRHDHQRSQQHAAEHQAAPAAGHMRHELHQEYPERVNADRHRDRIDHRGKEHRGRAAVQQFADAEIGVDAGRQRQDRGGEF